MRLACPELFFDHMMEALLYVFARDERLLRREVAIAELLEQADRCGGIKEVTPQGGTDKPSDCDADDRSIEE